MHCGVILVQSFRRHIGPQPSGLGLRTQILDKYWKQNEKMIIIFDNLKDKIKTK
jgi:hypothetical protein